MSSDWRLPWAASCRCGLVRMQIDAAPLVSMACHCSGCQKMTGGAYSVSLVLPASGFAITAGEPVIGALHGANRHFYCPYCMSWIFTRPAGMPDIVNLRATMLDNAGWFTPFVETATNEKLPGVVTGAQRSFAGFPRPVEFPELMEAFIRLGARPGEARCAN